MKTFIITFCFFTSTYLGFAQKLTQQDIVGNWNVHKIINSPNDLQFQKLANSFKNATFSFYNNHKLNISSYHSTPIFNVYTEKVNNSRWFFDESSQHIKIGNQQNSFAIMDIIVKNQNQKIIFQVNKTDLIMEMHKQ